MVPRHHMHLILCVTHHQHLKKNFLTLSAMKFWIVYFSLFFFSLTKPANSNRENLMPEFERTLSSLPFFVDTQHLFQVPCSTKKKFFILQSFIYHSPHFLSDFFQVWKTVLGIAAVVEWLREFFFRKSLGIRFGLCNATSHPGDVEIRITSSSGLFKLLQSQLQRVQQRIETLHQALVILWATSGWDSFIGIVFLLCGQREMNWMNILLCHTDQPMHSTCVQVRTHCSLKYHDPWKGCRKYICLACCHFAAGCNLITSPSLGQASPQRTIEEGKKSIL